MKKEEVLSHLYMILLNYIEADLSVSLCKTFVLYSVKSYQQKDATNNFIVSFIKNMDHLIYDNEEFQTLIEIINKYVFDPLEMKHHLKVIISIKEKLLNYWS